MNRALTWALVPAGITVAWLAARAQHRNGRPWTFLLADVTPGLVSIASGLLIWRRRPQNRCWWLLVAAGFAWYIGDFEHSLDRNVALGGFAFSAWNEAFLGWAVLAFPSGRLQLRHARVLTASLFVLVATRSMSRIFLHVPPDVAGYGTANRFLAISDDRWWRGAESAFAWVFTTATLLVLASVARRWIESSRPARRMLTPALFAATVLAGAVGYDHLIGWNAPIPGGAGVRAYYVVAWAHAAMALALATGLVRLRRTRSAVVDLVAARTGRTSYSTRRRAGQGSRRRKPHPCGVVTGGRWLRGRPWSTGRAARRQPEPGRDPDRAPR